MESSLLITKLGSTEWKERRDAAIELGKMKEEGAIPALAGLLGDAHPQVREAAAKALGDIGEPAAAHVVGVLEKGGETGKENALYALELIANPEHGAHIMNVLETGDNYVRERAVRALGKMKYGGAAERIAEIAKSAGGSLASAAINALGELKAAESLGFLFGVAEAARGSNSELKMNVGKAAVDAIQKMDSAGAVPVFLEKLNCGNADSEALALKMLLKRKEPGVAAALLDKMEKVADAQVRKEIEDAISGMDAGGPVPVFLEKLKSEDRSARLFAMKMLLKMGEPEAIAPVATLIRGLSKDELIQVGKSISADNFRGKGKTGMLTGLLGHRLPDARLWAFWALTDRPNTAKGAALMLLGDSASYTRVSAMDYLLQKHGNEHDVVEAAARMLGDPYERVRELAKEILANNYTASFDLISEALLDEKRKAHAEQLIMKCEADRPHLTIHLLKDKNPKLREEGEKLLLSMGNKGFRELIKAFEHDWMMVNLAFPGGAGEQDKKGFPMKNRDNGKQLEFPIFREKAKVK